MFVQRLARDPGLDHAIEILRMHGDDAVHVAEVDRDSAERRVDVALERGTRAERDHRHPMRRAHAHDLLHVLGGLRKHHRIRRLVRNPGGGVGVLLAHRARRDQAVAEPRGQRMHDRHDPFRVAAAGPLWGDWCHHSSVPRLKTCARTASTFRHASGSGDTRRRTARPSHAPPGRCRPEYRPSSPRRTAGVPPSWSAPPRRR